MEQKAGRKKPIIELRYYDLPEHGSVLALQGEEWVRVYSDGTRTLHFHNLMEIGLCHWGQGTMVLDDKDIPYTDGEVTLIPANCLHTTISKDSGLNHWAYLFVNPDSIIHKAFPNDALYAEAIVRRLESDARCLSGAEAAPLARLIELILAEESSDKTYHNELVDKLITALLLMAARLSGAGEGTAVPAVSNALRPIMPALEYISHNYMNQLSIKQLAAQCSLSEAHLRRKFQEYLHMSPLEQLTIVRMRRGCELLNTTDFSVSEVALRVGYQSVSSFSRNFQHFTGFSPYQYKKLKLGGSYKDRPIGYTVSAKRGWEKRDDM